MQAEGTKVAVGTEPRSVPHASLGMRPLCTHRVGRPPIQMQQPDGRVQRVATEHCVQRARPWQAGRGS